MGKRMFSRWKMRRFRKRRYLREKRIGIDLACRIVPAIKRLQKEHPKLASEEIAKR